MNGPELSVLIVTRNRPDDLRRCLNSVYANCPPTTQVVVVDNGSEKVIIQALQREYRDVQWFRLPKNYGDWQARDIGRLQCQAPFILSLDDDCELATDAPTNLLDACKRDMNIAVAQPKVIEPRRSPGKILGPHHDPEVPHYLANFLGGACVYNAQALELAGGFPHFLLGGAEIFLSFQFLDLGFRIVYIPTATILHWASPIERIQWKRLYLCSSGRLRATLRNEPRLVFRVAHLFWKPIALAVACIQRGHYLSAAILPFFLFVHGIPDILRRPKCKAGTARMMQQIRSQMHLASLQACTGVDANDVVCPTRIP